MENLEDIQPAPAGVTLQMVFSALFAALIAVGAWLALPTPWFGVPVVLQNFFVYLAALVLPWRWAGMTLLVYLLAGGLGLPVFSGFTGGWGHFLGPTGGFLLSYLPAAVLMAVISGNERASRWRDVPALVLGTVLIYGMGIGWLVILFPEKAFWGVLAAMTPFLVADSVKMAVAFGMAFPMRAVLRASLQRVGGAPDPVEEAMDRR